MGSKTAGEGHGVGAEDVRGVGVWIRQWLAVRWLTVWV